MTYYKSHLSCHKKGKDSDHKGVECLPRTNLATVGGAMRKKILVRRFPQSKIYQFGLTQVDNNWYQLDESLEATSLVDTFVGIHIGMVEQGFPMKQIQVEPDEKPYFTEELRQLKRGRQRAYTAHGGRSRQYLDIKAHFEHKLITEAHKYKTKKKLMKF